MILKDHEIPHKLLQAEALTRRLTQSHFYYPKIEEIYAREKSGYTGELAVDYPLKKLGFNYASCHDLRLPYFNHHFQMDTLLLTSHFFLILEVKNLPGVISFDTVSNKMIRTLEGETTNFDDPVIQVREQRFQLEEKIKELGVAIPIEHLVVMTHPNTILKIEDDQTDHRLRITPVYALAEKIRKLHHHYKPQLQHSEAIQIGRQLIKQHQPYRGNLLKKYNIDPQKLIKGVFCPNCGSRPMKWVSRSWECGKCRVRDKQAHVEALKDYYLLIGSTISKRELMEFLLLGSERTARHIINRMNLTRLGKSSNTSYQMRSYFNEFIKK